MDCGYISAITGDEMQRSAGRQNSLINRLMKKTVMTVTYALIILHVWCVIIIIITIIICYHLHNYLLDTNHASRTDNAAAVLRLQCMVHVVVLPVINLS
jgi:uncharacterized membrane protein